MTDLTNLPKDKQEYRIRRNKGLRGQGDKYNPAVGMYSGGQANAKPVGAKAVKKQTKRYRKALQRQYGGITND